MKVLIVTNTKIKSGGYRSAKNIHKAIISAGVEADFPEFQTQGSGFFNNLRNVMLPYLDRIPLRLYPHRRPLAAFSTGMAGINLRKFMDFSQYNLIHLHWINGGFISFRSLRWLLKKNIPVVWTFHDFWPFTGGCHVYSQCNRFEQQCGKCPLLGSNRFNDLSHKIWNKKNKILKRYLINPVAVSKWQESHVLKSSLYQSQTVTLIHNTVDTDLFKPIPRLEARNILNLEADKFYILSGAMGLNAGNSKGFQYILQAASKVAGLENAEFIFFGDLRKKEMESFPLTYRNFGLIDNDYVLSLVYSAADLFISASPYETGPLTILESMACGTPVAAFPAGIIPEVVEHKVNSYLVNGMDHEDLFEGIQWFYFMSEEEKEKTRKYARNKITEEFSLSVAGIRYRDLFEKTISK